MFYDYMRADLFISLYKKSHIRLEILPLQIDYITRYTYQNIYICNTRTTVHGY